ncbi:hypothetical protein J4727_13630 [Providencia rettgeri]|uniref:Uncharacterized protein n=1 Tax=Providencia rettgeri TaxID=587 RepID=A0A939SJF4_PRORE|nr:hypothetical protein [Providencia rettgeri]
MDVRREAQIEGMTIIMTTITAMITTTVTIIMITTMIMNLMGNGDHSSPLYHQVMSTTIITI